MIGLLDNEATINDNFVGSEHKFNDIKIMCFNIDSLLKYWDETKLAVEQ